MIAASPPFVNPADDECTSRQASAVGIGLTRAREASVVLAEPRGSIWAEAVEGLRFVVRDPMLRRIMLAAGAFVFFDSAFFGLYVLYVTRDLGVGPGELGVIFMLGGVGGTVGALLLAGAGDMLIPWADVVPTRTVPVLGLVELIVTFGVSVFTVNELTLRQRITPDALQGRMHATYVVVVGGCTAIGALAGGLVAEYVGVRTFLFVSATATIGGGLWLLSTAVWRLRAGTFDR
jgi:predicted MFS family arabinose efflux permease